MPVTSVCTDACNVAARGHFCGDWFYSSWEADWPDMQDAHINVKELASVILAANRWAPLWSNKRIIILSDNTTTVSCLNRGRPTSRNCQLMKYLRYMFWLSVIYKFRLTACHVPGVNNVLADRLSRLHEVGAQCDVFDLIVHASPLKWHICYLRVTCMLLTGPSHPRQGFLDSLDSIVQLLRGQVFAPSTRATYRSQQRLYLQFCDLAGLNPVPLSQANACRYIAFLSQRLAYNSVKLYINVVRIMHLEAGHANPFSNSWIVDTLLKGTKRVL